MMYIEAILIGEWVHMAPALGSGSQEDWARLFAVLRDNAATLTLYDDDTIMRACEMCAQSLCVHLTLSAARARGVIPLHEVTSLFETPGNKKFPHLFTMATAPREDTRG